MSRTQLLKLKLTSVCNRWFFTPISTPILVHRELAQGQDASLQATAKCSRRKYSCSDPPLPRHATPGLADLATRQQVRGRHSRTRTIPLIPVNVSRPAFTGNCFVYRYIHVRLGDGTGRTALICMNKAHTCVFLASLGFPACTCLSSCVASRRADTKGITLGQILYIPNVFAPCPSLYH